MSERVECVNAQNLRTQVLKCIELGGGEYPLYKRKKDALRSDGAPPSVWALGIRHALDDSDCGRLIDRRKPPPPNPNFHPRTIVLAKSRLPMLDLITNSEARAFPLDRDEGEPYHAI